MRVAVITPWLAQHHLLPAYAEATRDARPVIVDTAPERDGALEHYAHARDGAYIHMPARPFSYAAACNAGLAAAAYLGASVAVCLNNDIEGNADWLADVARLPDGVLAGPEVLALTTLGQPHLYVAGWCVAATMATWEHISLTATLHDSEHPEGPWDSAALVGSYHEDVDLSWRAARAGVYLQARPWALRHLGETTARVTPGATAHHAHNRAVFAARVRAWQEGGVHA